MSTTGAADPEKVRKVEEIMQMQSTIYDLASQIKKEAAKGVELQRQLDGVNAITASLSASLSAPTSAGAAVPPTAGGAGKAHR